MGDTTHIGWTDHTHNESLLPKSFTALEFSYVARAVRFVVFEFVAWMAKGQSIANIVPQLWVSCERLDVMRAEIAAFGVAALLACVLVACEHCIAPHSVLRLPTITERTLGRAMSVIRMVRAALGGPCPPCFHFGESGRGASNALLLARSTAQRGTDSSLGLFGMTMPLECRDATLPTFPHLYATAPKARGCLSVAAQSVDTKVVKSLPILAGCAPFQPGRHARSELLDADASKLGGGLQRAFFSLCHVHNVTRRSH